MRRAVTIAAAAICAVGFPLSMYLVFFRAPVIDARELYFNQKIFYYHVPPIFMLFLTVFVCGIASLRYLRGRDPRQDDVAEAAGELGVLLGAVMLVTGSLWGKAAWGHWWVWDARLTSALLLWMVMVAYVLVRRYGGAGSDRLAAGVAVFAMADVPLIYFSVKIWRTVHPETSVVPGLSGDMRLAFWFCVLLFLALYVLLLDARVGLGRARRRLIEAREQALDAGILE
jgi:heme exporter protein C